MLRRQVQGFSLLVQSFRDNFPAPPCVIWLPASSAKALSILVFSIPILYVHLAFRTDARDWVTASRSASDEPEVWVS